MALFTSNLDNVFFHASGDVGLEIDVYLPQKRNKYAYSCMHHNLKMKKDVLLFPS